MKAIVIGATGAVGSALVERLLKDDRYSEVAAFVRRETGLSHPKLRAHIIDFDRPEEWRGLVTGDVLFSALGTSLKQAGSKEAQHHIDYDYTLSFARAAKENGVPHFVLVSSLGADDASRFFYMKLKGEIERDVRALAFPALTILRPPSLIRPKTKRPLETVSVKTFLALAALGLARSMKPMHVKAVAEAMASLGAESPSGEQLITAQEILRYTSEKE